MVSYHAGGDKMARMKGVHGGHLAAAVVGIVLATALTHRVHMNVLAAITIAMVLGAAGWMVFGTLWWLLSEIFRRGGHR